MWSISRNSLSPTSLSIVLGTPTATRSKPLLLGQAGDLVGRVHRVVAADVEEIADIVGPKHVDHPLEVLLLPFAELVAAGADRAGRGRKPQQRHFFRRLGGKIEQLLLEHALDAMPGPIDGADLTERPGRLEDPLQTAIDNRGRSATLGHDEVD